MRVLFALVTAIVIFVGVYCGIRDFRLSPAFLDLTASATQSNFATSQPPSSPASDATQQPVRASNNTEEEQIDRQSPTPPEDGQSIQVKIRTARALYEKARETYRAVVENEAAGDTLHNARKHIEEARTILNALPDDSSQVEKLRQSVRQMQNAIIKSLPL